MLSYEELRQKVLNGEPITEEDFPTISRSEKILINCINKMGCESLCAPQSRIEMLLQLLCTQSSNGSGGGIVDLKKLPAHEWISTPLPRKDYIGKIYFNTSLSVDEVNDLISKNVGSSGTCSIQILKTYENTGLTREIIEFKKANNQHYIKYTVYENGIIVINDTIYLNKWFKSEIEFGYLLQQGYKELRSELSTSDNTPISSLVSITPFKCSVDANSIYRLPDDSLWVYQDGWTKLTTTSLSTSGEIIYVDTLPNEGWIGTPVPNSGYVENVYLNLNLSSEEVEKLFELIELQQTSLYKAVVCKSNTEKGIYIRPSEKKMFFNGGGTFFADGVWKTTKEIVSINDEVILNNNGEVVGHQNDLLSPLISVTPFKHAGETGTICCLPDGTLWEYQDGWKQLETSSGNGGSAGVQLKLVERLESIDTDTSLLNGDGVVNLTKELKPNAVYYIKYTTNFGYMYCTNLFTYDYGNSGYVVGYSNMMVVEGDDEERACGYFEYEHTDSVNMLTLKGQIAANSLSVILELEIYELTASATQTEDEVTVIDLGITDEQYDLLENGRYIIDYSNITGIVQLNFGTFKYKKGTEEVTLGKFLAGQVGINQSNFYDYAQENENSWIMLKQCDYPIMIDVSEKMVTVYPLMNSTI